MDTERIIKTCLSARIPVLATGEPGTGKTGWGLTLKKSGWEVIQVIGSVREPADIGGWPMRTEEGLVLEPGAWAKKAHTLAAEGKKVVVMWDEARCINSHTQSAIMKVIHENLAGDFEMDQRVTHLAFANSVEDSAGGVPLEPPFANRLVHVPWIYPVDKWCVEMSTGAYAPQKLLEPEALARLTMERANVAAYINKARDQLHQMPKEEEKRDGPWPSPRTWDYAAHLWAAASDSDWGFREELLAACVGIPCAGQFIAWRNNADLLDPEDVIAGKYEDGKLVLVDKARPDRTFAILSSVLASIYTNWDEKRYIGGWKALNHVAEEGAADIAAAFLFKLMESAEGKSVPAAAIAKYVTPFADMLRRAKGSGA